MIYKSNLKYPVMEFWFFFLQLTESLNSYFQCLLQISPDLPSRYLIGQDASVKSFQSAMGKCLRFGAHSVHINSELEHRVIINFIHSSST